MSYPQALGAYEVDHFIPLEIGGSNDIKNLWLEPATPTPGFHQKDQFENFEHGQVCDREITAAEAQSRMVSDWYFYWQEEVEGATANTSATAQSAPAPQAATTADASATYYTSSY
ncbi:MAG: HNH endonuclease signature motif containing protein, partial [Rhodomicrobium sp.]